MARHFARSRTAAATPIWLRLQPPYLCNPTNAAYFCNPLYVPKFSIHRLIYLRK
jgi:hypothetical protein